MPAYGVFSNAGQGHVVTSILIAMIAMVFTAMSYGRMARVYPSAGSAYTYVGRELHPSLGYVTGWSMTMDYILNPLICTIWSAKAMADLLSGTRYQISGLALARVLCRAVHGAEPARRQVVGSHQRDPVRHHGRCYRGLLLVHHPLHLPFAAIPRGVFSAPLL
jgi:amino acid transporter